jgi:hypothetical protein
MNKSDTKNAVNNFIELYNDGLSIRGKTPMNRREKHDLRKTAGSIAKKLIEDSQRDVQQSLVHYCDTPKALRVKLLETSFYNMVVEQAFHNPVLRFLFLSLCYEFEGIKLDDEFKQFIGSEVSRLLIKITRELGTEGTIKIGVSDLGFSPGSIAGMDERLKYVLKQHFESMSENVSSEYEQDLLIAFWKCSEGENLDEFTKILDHNGDHAAAIAKAREIFSGQGKEAIIRGIIIRILRKTISNLSDIKDAVNDYRDQSDHKRIFVRDESVERNDEIEPLFDTIKSPDSGNIEDDLENEEQLHEWKTKVKQFTTRELQVFENELAREQSNKTREEYYGKNEALKVTQQLKYIKKKYSG